MIVCTQEVRVGDLGNKTSQWGLGRRFSLIMGKGLGTGWSSASDTGGVTANKSDPCAFSPDSNFIFVSSITGNWGGKAEEQMVSEGHFCDIPAKTKNRRVKFQACAPYSNFPLINPPRDFNSIIIWEDKRLMGSLLRLLQADTGCGSSPAWD